MCWIKGVSVNDDTNKFDAIVDAAVLSDDKAKQAERSVDRSTMSQTDDDGSIVPIIDDDIVELSPDAIELVDAAELDQGPAKEPIASIEEHVDGPASTTGSKDLNSEPGKVRVAPPGSVVELINSPRRKRLVLKTKPDKSKRSMVRARLMVIEPNDQRTTVYLDQPDLVLGRGLDTDILLMDDGASRHHARFERHDLGFSIIDLDSGNGTYVNGRQVQSFDLFDGDIIVIGKTKIRFETVGWRRVPQPRASFVNSVLKTEQTPSSASRWASLAIACLCSFMVVLGIGLLKAPPGQDFELLMDEQITRTQEKIATTRFAEARIELAYAQVLANLIGQQPISIDQLMHILADQSLLEEIDTGAKDGLQFEKLVQLGEKVSSSEDSQKQLLIILNSVRNQRSNTHKDLAQRAYDAGRGEVALRHIDFALTYRPSDSDLKALKEKIVAIKHP